MLQDANSPAAGRGRAWRGPVIAPYPRLNRNSEFISYLDAFRPHGGLSRVSGANERLLRNGAPQDAFETGWLARRFSPSTGARRAGCHCCKWIGQPCALTPLSPRY